MTAEMSGILKYTGLIFCLTLAAVAGEPISLFYHESYGIAEAARIKNAEQGLDCDQNRCGDVAQPYLGGLIISLTTGHQSVCASSLLSNTKLVTAAHCWWDGRSQGHQITVVLGSARLFSGGERINTNSVQMHENFDPINLNNDIAIITIGPVSFTNLISPINIATGSNQFVGNWASAAGFGKTCDSCGVTRNSIIRQINVQVIPNTACSAIFGNSIVVESTICTSGANGNDLVYQGYSGGPLATGSGSNRQLIGVMSFVARGGCHNGTPSGYARVSCFASWIYDRLYNHSNCQKPGCMSGNKIDICI